MRKRYILAICLSAFLRAQAQQPSDTTVFGPQQVLTPSLVGLRNIHVVDLNGDKAADILAGSSRGEQTGKIVWYENDGRGNFGEERTVQAEGDEVKVVYTADVDGDGDQDILAASRNDGSTSKVVWYENDGQGNFSRPQLITTRLFAPYGIHAADLDNDGDQDVLSASFDGIIAWYENKDGRGNFGQQQIISLQADLDVYTADLDADGDQDVLSTSFLDGVAWYENDGQGNFEEQQIITTNTVAPFNVYAADLDEDEDLDVLTISPNDDGKVIWYENDGQGNFNEEHIITNQANGTHDVYAADLDRDGDLDVLATSTDQGWGLAWYENDGQGNFGPQQVITTQTDRARSVYTNDIDGDGDQDVLSASFGDAKIAWYENDGLGSFGQQQIVTVAQANGAYAVYATDLDSDGDQDILSASRQDDKIAWYENDGTGSFKQQQTIAVASDLAEDVYAADLDGDGDQDVLSASYLGGLAWYSNEGQGSFGSRQFISFLDIRAKSIYTADLDGDGDQDVIAASFRDGIYWFENDGKGNFDDKGIVAEVKGASSVYAADLDGDDAQDILFTAGSRMQIDIDNRVAWIKNDGQGSFGEQQVIRDQAYGANAVYAADLDKDGDLDILSASSSNFYEVDQVTWYENQGSAGFGAAQVISTQQNGSTDVYAADLDQDGNVDILSSAFYDSKVVWYKSDGQGSFAEQTAITTRAGGAASVYAADLDNDGDLDVLSASYGDDKIAWHKNLVDKPPYITSVTPMQDSNSTNLRAYPNVFRETLFIATKLKKEQVQVRLLSVLGKIQIEEARLHQEEEGLRLDARHIRAGHYILQVMSTEGARALHVIKE